MSAAPPIPSVFDVNSLTSLKSQVKSDDPEALRAAAKQFEAMFLQMVLKSMRDSVPKDGLFDNDQSRMYESMLDQQLALSLAGKSGLGLAQMVERQLSQKPTTDPSLFENGLPMTPPTEGLPLDDAALSRMGLQVQSTLARAYARVAVDGKTRDTVDSTDDALSAQGTEWANGDAAADFVARMRPHALAAERSSGIPAHFMVAQAALETGWGRAEPRTADGRPSFNLFGIKAGRAWQGATVEASTLEYVNGKPQRQSERFRAYGSYAEAFSDYARLLTETPRYSAAASSRDGAGFAHALQSAGYASDPQYAAKLERIISSPALRDLKRS